MRRRTTCRRLSGWQAFAIGVAVLGHCFRGRSACSSLGLIRRLPPFFHVRDYSAASTEPRRSANSLPRERGHNGWVIPAPVGRVQHVAGPLPSLERATAEDAVGNVDHHYNGSASLVISRARNAPGGRCLPHGSYPSMAWWQSSKRALAYILFKGMSQFKCAATPHSFNFRSARDR